MNGICRSCGAPIMWLEHVTTGKPAPIDIQASMDGNIRIGVIPEHYGVLTGQDLADAQERGDELHKSHYATCPQAPAWRAKRRPA